MSGIQLLEGDITDQEVDALVNAANTHLILGSGVAGAILEKGGASIEAECSSHAAIGLGESAVTGGGGREPREALIRLDSGKLVRGLKRRTSVLD